MNRTAPFVGIIVTLLAAPLPAPPLADLGGVTVRLENYRGPATILARALGLFQVQVTLDPKTETQPLTIRVELPNSGPRAWPAADVEVRDAQGKVLMVRRSGIDWFNLLIPVPAVAGTYFVQAVPPAGGKPPMPSDQERVLMDNAASLRLSVTTWYDGRQAALSLRFDDSHPTHLTKAIPILREYGFRGTFMINPGADEPGSRRRSNFQAHRAEWEAVARAGDQEFANHSAHHRGATGDADMEAQIGQAAQAIWDLVPGRSRLMALNLGGGTQWETTRPLRYYLDKYHQFETSGSLGMDDVYGRRVAAFREHLEAHLERGLWCRAHFHSIGAGLSSSEANFRSVLDVVKEHQSDLWIAGMADIHKYRAERNASKLTRRQSDAQRLTFQFTCLTDTTLYDQPLTLEVAPPPSVDVSRITVKDAQGKAVSLRTAGAQGAPVVRFDVPPRDAVYSIEMAPSGTGDACVAPTATARILPAVLQAAGAAAPVRPNILFIMADDLGWRDLGCYGSQFHQTPNLDRLATRGVRFTQAYAANPLCSPTRSSVLTGLWPARTGITAPACHLPQVVLEKQLVPGNPNMPVLVASSVTRLKTDYVTLPKVLRDAGYRTGHFGKWHLGAEPYSPLQHGFEVDWPHWPGPGPAGSYVAPWKFPATLKIESQPGEHIEDTVSSQVVKFIRENKDRPFYVNYWPFSVHSPYDAKDELVAKYRNRADPRNPQRNPVYGAMVESLDDGVGRVLAALEECGLVERTVIVFFSDNGGVSWGGPGDAVQHKSARFPADMTAPPTSNLPLRNGKASLYEGGVRVPCLVVWPGVTKPGTVNDTAIQSIDWMPTLLDMVGVPLPQNARPDGVSLAPLLQGGTLARDTIFCHFPHDTPASGQHPGTSVRHGDWKLIRLHARNDDGTDQLELYNLRDDLGETKNRAAEEPERVRELNALITKFLADTGAVVPVRNPRYQSGAAKKPGGRPKQ